MSSVLRSVGRRKKKRLGEVQMIRREEYAGIDIDAKVEMIRALVPLGLMHVQELLDDEVRALAGERYARKETASVGCRYGSNPGTVGLAGQRVAIRVPRVRGGGGEIALRSYDALHGDGAVNDVLLKRVLYGISCRNYEAAAESIPGAIGLSSSTVSLAAGIDGLVHLSDLSWIRTRRSRGSQLQEGPGNRSHRAGRGRGPRTHLARASSSSTATRSPPS